MLSHAQETVKHDYSYRAFIESFLTIHMIFMNSSWTSWIL